MARSIHNPFRGTEGYNCFGCSPDNESGLKMHFEEEGEEVVSRWNPDRRFQGFIGVLHGGVQATLMDELASWFVFAKLGTAGVTARMEVIYHKPVMISKGPLVLRARLAEQKRRLAVIRVTLTDHDGTLCSEGMMEYFLFPPEKARQELMYPGQEFFLR